MCAAISLHKVRNSVSEIKSVNELLTHEEVDIWIKIPQKMRCVHTLEEVLCTVAFYMKNGILLKDILMEVGQICN